MSRHILRRALVDAGGLPTSLHPALRRVYAARGLQRSDELDLRLDKLIPVSALGGLTPAVELLLRCHRERARVLVVGDFDADGATSTALVMRQLQRLGFADPQYVVPDRFKYGYGLTPPIVRLAAEHKPSVLITVDNGIASHEGVAEAARLGIEVLITDHHLPGATLPPAAAIVNPNLHGEAFPSKALAGVGVAFYLMAALTRRMRETGMLPAEVEANPADLLDLVALGTIADLVPLDFNNRILVAQGLKRIRAGRCVPGIVALLEAGKRSHLNAVAQDLAFQAGPRLNAAGRLEDMRDGIECLLADDLGEARTIAARLQQLNLDRRDLETKMQGEALVQVEQLLASLAGAVPAGLALFDANWHQGVVGLVASRVKDRVHRPVVAFAPGDAGWLKGSARSVAGVHIRDVLDALAKREPTLIERFGGHAMAAGMSIRDTQFDAFAREFAVEVARWVDPATLTGDLLTDGMLAAGEFNADTAQALREGGPWGSAFPEPVFDGHFEVLERRVVSERHLKMRLRAASGEQVAAIAFRHFDAPEALAIAVGDRIEVVYRTELDTYGGQQKLQLLVEWLAITGARVTAPRA